MSPGSFPATEGVWVGGSAGEEMKPSLPLPQPAARPSPKRSPARGESEGRVQGWRPRPLLGLLETVWRGMAGTGLGQRQVGLEPWDPRSARPTPSPRGPDPAALTGLSPGSGRLALSRACVLGLARVGLWDIPPPRPVRLPPFSVRVSPCRRPGIPELSGLLCPLLQTSRSLGQGPTSLVIINRKVTSDSLAFYVQATHLSHSPGGLTGPFWPSERCLRTARWPWPGGRRCWGAARGAGPSAVREQTNALCSRQLPGDDLL